CDDVVGGVVAAHVAPPGVDIPLGGEFGRGLGLVARAHLVLLCLGCGWCVLRHCATNRGSSPRELPEIRRFFCCSEEPGLPQWPTWGIRRRPHPTMRRCS